MIPRILPLAAPVTTAVLTACLAVGGASPARAQAQNPSFNLINRTRTTITELYATPPGVSNWGQDRLGDNTVGVGSSFPVRLPANGNCRYDIRVVYEDGRSEERRNVNTCTVSDVTFGQGGSTAQGGTQGGSTQGGGTQGGGTQGGGQAGNQNGEGEDDGGQAPRRNGRALSFTILNRSETTITAVYASPTGNNNWGQDWLGSNGIAFAQRRTIRLQQQNGSCTYDIRFDYADRSKFEKRNVDLCAESPTLSVN